jgi:hypothetical protein
MSAISDKVIGQGGISGWFGIELKRLRAMQLKPLSV